MKRRLPPLPAIRAFEAAARHGSFRRAADEIAVTPSAISHQVRALEAHLGCGLFRRAPGGLALTEAGAAYARELTALLDGLDASTRGVSEAMAEGPLTVHCTPGFAARWLVPRLDRLPGGERISVTVSHGAPSTDFATNGADIVIHWGDAPVDGAAVLPLMRSVQYPVAAGGLVAREGLRRPADLARARLIHAEVMDAWGEWFARAGVAAPELPRGPVLAHCELSLVAAENGQGVALAYDAMARSTVASGRLVRLFETEIPAITIYSVAYPETRARCPTIRAVCDWLFEEVAAEGTSAVGPPAPVRARG